VDESRGPCCAKTAARFSKSSLLRAPMSTRSTVPRHHFWKDDDAAFTVSSTLVLSTESGTRPFFASRDSASNHQNRAGPSDRKLGLSGGLIGVSLLTGSGGLAAQAGPNPNQLSAQLLILPTRRRTIMRLHPGRPWISNPQVHFARPRPFGRRRP
jgi:hypothetical protein